MYFSDMKEGIKSVFVYILIIFSTLSIFSSSVQFPNSFTYLLATILLLSLTVMVACPLLNFLTIKCQFPTFFLMSLLLLTGVMYLLKLFMTDFYIEQYMFEGMQLGNIQINSFEVIPLMTIGIVAVIVSFFAAIYRELDSK